MDARVGLLLNEISNCRVCFCIAGERGCSVVLGEALCLSHVLLPLGFFRGTAGPQQSQGRPTDSGGVALSFFSLCGLN